MIETNISRRGFVELAGGLAAVAGLGLAGCGNTQVDAGSSAGSAEAESTLASVADMTTEEEEAAWKKEPAYGETLTVGFNGGVCLGGFGIAKAQGFDAEEGLETEIVSMNSTTDAIGTGQVACAGDHIATLLVPAVNGVKMMFTTASATGCKSLYVLNDSDIQSTSDLVGQTIGLTDGIGGSDQNICMRFLNHDDIEIDAVTWKAVNSDAIIQALQSGEVQGAMLSDQFAYSFVKDGTIRYIRSITWDEDFQQEPCCVLAFNTDFINENPVTAKKYTRAFRKACEWIQDNKEEAIQIMFDNNWASGDQDVALEMCEAFNFDIPEQWTEDALLNIIADYKKFGVLETEDDDETVLNNVWVPILGE